MANVSGTASNDFIHRAGDGLTPPAGFNDIGTVTTGADTILPGAGNDVVFGDAGDDSLIFHAAAYGSDVVDLGDGADRVNATDVDSEIRLTFTSSEVGNNNASDSNTMMNQDGGLAVRMQQEDGSGALTGLVSRFDDEGITFVASGGSRFDVRDLVSGIERGNLFRTVTLGTIMGDTLVGTSAADYINAGQGSDNVSGGQGNDFLVGGAGDDTLDGGEGDDSFIGGGGSDTITGGAGNDSFIFNVSTDGSDSVSLGVGSDTATINAAAPTNVRLTFTSAEVGNGSAQDGNSLPNQDGGLAVRLQAEGGDGNPLAATTRLDDEGITFVAGAGVTFDVRDISGTQRGELFEVVTLGADASETLVAVQSARPYYINAGQGDDMVYGGAGNDFLVGGAGNDRLLADQGDDNLLGGSGNDLLDGGAGADAMEGGAGDDTYVVDSASDKVTEANFQGTDTVESSVGFTLRSTPLENLTLTGSAAISATGNSLENVLKGNGAANILSGTAGDDRLIGGWGKDTLIGGVDEDTFVFDQRLLKSFEADVITDFVSKDDTIELSSKVFLGLSTDKNGILSASQFKDLSVKEARVDQDDRIVYDKAKGDIFYDRDGSGAEFKQVKFAELKDNTALVDYDFLVV